MPIGTSLGQFFKTEMDFHTNQFDSRDENEIKPLEITKGDIEQAITDPKIMMGDKMVVDDPANIYNEQGDIVDYDRSVPASQINNIDLSATQTPNDRVQAGFDALKP